MAWVMLSLRKSELRNSISQNRYELIQLNSYRNKLSNFSTAVGDGTITPSEIASLGPELFGDALDFMGYSNEVASQMAQEQTDYYSSAYEGITQEQYYNNPSISAEAQLYFNQDGALDTDAMISKFYEANLKEFAEKYIMPIIKEQEEELDNKKQELETLIQSQEAELDSIDNTLSEQISKDTIKLS